MIAEVWQMAIWLTLFFVLLSIGLQYLLKRNDQKNVDRILEENKHLSSDIAKLHDKLASLNDELVRLYSENKILSDEVEKLNTRVNMLQTKVFHPLFL